MPKTSVDVQSWSRFRISELSIAASLAGCVHRFPCAGKIVEIRIPKRQRIVSQAAAFDERESIFCNSWWQKSGRPISFTVRSVDVVVHLKHKTKILPTALERVDVGLFPTAERQRLDRFIAAGEQTASEAFDRWVRILRWQSRIHQIGQPEVAGRESGWGTYLQDSGSEKHFYTNSRVHIIQNARTLSRRVWRATGEALQDSRIQPPLWFDFLFDGEHRIGVGDLHGGIVSLAIACESLFRALLLLYLGEHDDEIVNLMNQINISRIIDRWSHLRRVQRWGAKVDLRKIKRLFELRNGIAHRGQIRDLKPSECADFAKAARAFVLLGDNKVG